MPILLIYTYLIFICFRPSIGGAKGPKIVAAGPDNSGFFWPKTSKNQVLGTQFTDNFLYEIILKCLSYSYILTLPLSVSAPPLEGLKALKLRLQALTTRVFFGQRPAKIKF